MRFDLNDAISVLERTPATLRAMLQGLPDSWVTATEGGESWSPFTIVGHLLHGERTDWIPRAGIILAQGPSRRFEPFDRFAQFEASRGRTLDELLASFEELRRANLSTLRSWGIDEAKLALEGEHPDLGTVTLRQLLSTWVAHDLSHIAQVGRVMARQYAMEVGPWRAYLPILFPPEHGAAIPILRVEDLEASVAYYTDKLGFSLDWNDDGMAQLRRGHALVMLCPGDQGHPGSWLWTGVPNADRAWEEMRARGARLRHPPTNYPWGSREFQATDLDGNVLRFGGPHRDGEPLGEWLDGTGRRWIPVETGGWREVSG